MTDGSTAYPQWGLQWTYDRYGNRTGQTVTAETAPSNSLTVNPVTNRITSTGFSYDNSGNLINDAQNSYAYTRNDPVNLADPLGLEFFPMAAPLDEGWTPVSASAVMGGLGVFGLRAADPPGAGYYSTWFESWAYEMRVAVELYGPLNDRFPLGTTTLGINGLVAAGSFMDFCPTCELMCKIDFLANSVKCLLVNVAVAAVTTFTSVLAKSPPIPGRGPLNEEPCKEAATRRYNDCMQSGRDAGCGNIVPPMPR